MKCRCFAFTAVVVSIVTASPALADFSCPNTGKIVSNGMNQYEVEAACGPAAAKTALPRTISQANGVVTQGDLIEEWTYDFGPNRFIEKFHFVNGILKSDENTGRYGVKARAQGRQK